MLKSIKAGTKIAQRGEALYASRERGGTVFLRDKKLLLHLAPTIRRSELYGLDTGWIPSFLHLKKSTVPVMKKVIAPAGFLHRALVHT
eukprot:SAG11_NODE_1152_length_5663_cov_110.803379_3_plen_88_part_00